MKICILTHTFPRFIGDTATPFMGNLATALGKTGHKIYVLTPFDPKLKTKNGGPFTLLSYKYILPKSLHILGYARSFQSGKQLSFLAYLIAPFMYLFGFLALLQLVKKERIDVVSAHWTIPNGFITRLVKLVTKTPYTNSIPGADMHMGGENELFRRMVGFAASGADHVISDSAHYIKQLNDLGFYPQKVSIIRYGVNTQVFKPTTKDINLLKGMGVDLNDKVILAVGRMVAQKGFIYLVRAFSQVLEKVPQTKLVIVGEGYEKIRLEKEALKLNIKDHIVFPGTILYDQLMKYYNLADVFVMPSIKDKEGNLDASPVAMMEAMACGVPIVATRFAGNEDLVIDGKTGYLVKEKNSQQITNALIKLLSNHTKKDVQSQVRKIAVNNFSIEQVARRYIEIFKDVIS